MSVEVADGSAVEGTSPIGIVAVLAATACWASAGVMVKMADLPGVVIAFWRLAMVAVIFALLAAVTGRRLSALMIRRSLVGGLLFGVNLAVWFEAFRHASVGVATVIAALTPVLAMFAGNRFLGEHISRLAIGCAATAIAGVTLFVVPGFSASGTKPLGIVLAVLGILIWVAYLFVTKKAREGVGTVEYMLAMSSIAAISLAPFVVLLNDDGLAPPDHGWFWLVALAIVPGSVGHGLLAWSQAHVPLSTSSILLQGEPVGAAAAGVVFLGESVVAIQIAGMAAAVVALAVLSRHVAGS